MIILATLRTSFIKIHLKQSERKLYYIKCIHTLKAIISISHVTINI